MTTVREALGRARALGVASLDAQLLLARVLATTRTRLIADDDRTLAADESRLWDRWIERRLAGEPIAYLLGEKEFHGLMLEVSADVLVPRPETELMVDWASMLIESLGERGLSDSALRDNGERAASAPRARPIRVVDLGTGSGAIAVALKQLRPHAVVTATDVSAAALAVARRNADRLSLAIEFVEASWWRGLEGRRFDVAVANPPYISAADPHLAALRHEPILALTPGGDGLAALGEIVAAAASHLAPRGRLLLEHGFDQGEAVRDLLAGAGFAEVETRRDLGGHERATGGRKVES